MTKTATRTAVRRCSKWAQEIAITREDRAPGEKEEKDLQSRS